MKGYNDRSHSKNESNKNCRKPIDPNAGNALMRAYLKAKKAYLQTGSIADYKRMEKLQKRLITNGGIFVVGGTIACKPPQMVVKL
jgi:hypothetical protein